MCVLRVLWKLGVLLALVWIGWALFCWAEETRLMREEFHQLNHAINETRRAFLP